MKKMIVLILFILPIFGLPWTTEIFNILSAVLVISKDPKDIEKYISLYFTTVSILFTMQSFLIPHMKEKVYDKDIYIAQLKEHYHNNWEKEQYRPLKNLLDFFCITITFCVLSMIFMLLFMLTNNQFVLITSIYYSIVSFVGLLSSFWITKNNLTAMLMLHGK